MNIGIIGMGFVGGTLAEVLKKAHKILPYDLFKEEYKDINILSQAEVIFICVPTPMKPSGEIDYFSIHHALDRLNNLFKEIPKKPLVVIRSTVVPGTTDDLDSKFPFDFVVNPEFLRERYAFQDMMNTDRVIIGAENDDSTRKLFHIYNPLFPNAKYLNFGRKTAEMIKYAGNIMLAGQVSLANELFYFCKAIDIDYNHIKQALLLDKRIARNIDVPGPDGDCGFGGKCFPKDLNALIYLAREKGYRPDLLEEIWRSNLRFRKNTDWEEIPGATSKNNLFEK